MQCGYFNIMKKQHGTVSPSWLMLQNQFPKKMQHSSVSQHGTEAIPSCSGFTPAEGTMVQLLKYLPKIQQQVYNPGSHFKFLWKKNLVVPQFPHLLYINNAHYANTGSLRSKGNPPGLPGPINKVQDINSLVMGCISTELWSNPTSCWTSHGWCLIRYPTTTFTLTPTSAIVFYLLFFLKQY